jgi:cytidine deaminase
MGQAHPEISTSLHWCASALDQAWEANARAYAPYSQFHVGAALLCQNRLFSGCNVENASYGLTVCAERHAIAAAVRDGSLRRETLEFIIVAAPTPRPTYPCGACRQVLHEFAHSHTLVILSQQPGLIHGWSLLGHLLPEAFGPKDLA